MNLVPNAKESLTLPEIKELKDLMQQKSNTMNYAERSMGSNL